MPRTYIDDVEQWEPTGDPDEDMSFATGTALGLVADPARFPNRRANVLALEAHFLLLDTKLSLGVGRKHHPRIVRGAISPMDQPLGTPVDDSDNPVLQVGFLFSPDFRERIKTTPFEFPHQLLGSFAINRVGVRIPRAFATYRHDPGFHGHAMEADTLRTTVEIAEQAEINFPLNPSQQSLRRQLPDGYENINPKLTYTEKLIPEMPELNEDQRRALAQLDSMAFVEIDVAETMQFIRAIWSGRIFPNLSLLDQGLRAINSPLVLVACPLKKSPFPYAIDPTTGGQKRFVLQPMWATFGRIHPTDQLAKWNIKPKQNIQNLAKTGFPAYNRPADVK